MPAQAAHFSRSARCSLRLPHVSTLLVQRLMVRCAWGPQAPEKLLSSGPPAPWLRIVYNCRDDTELEGRTLMGAGLDVCAKKGRVLLVLIVFLATVSYLIGCGAGSGGSSQVSEKQQASRTAGSSEQSGESSGQASGERLGHPALGSADAPVVLIEYSDYQ
jgi:hypothetical protein